MAESRPLTHADYAIAWICALPLELAAAEAVLDEEHPTLPINGVAHATYKLGKIAGHNIVLACLPFYGTTSATAVALQISSAFPNVRCGLMVGIGGGVPSKAADIRLGDIVVSKPVGRFSGVVQYDFGKSLRGGDFQLTGTLNQPPTIFLTATSQLEAQGMRQKDDVIKKLDQVFRRHPDMEESFSRPSEDRLFRATYDHPESETSCIRCDSSEVLHRAPRPTANPKVHYGTVASGNRVMKDGQERDSIAQGFDPLCFEMEAAGIMNHLPCLVIRGICDYCDSHKNKKWQGFAALVAAIYAKTLLAVVPVNSQRQPDQTYESTARVELIMKNETLSQNELSSKTQGSSNDENVGTWMVPFNRNFRFLAREDSISRIKDQFFSQKSARKAAISGLGGVGKTQIALELAYQVREEDPACSVLWIPATTTEAIEQAFMNINNSLGLSTADNDAKSQLKNYLSSERAGRWLLIIDNADDADMWMKADASSPAFKTFLPQSSTGFTLFTTRNQRLATQLVGPDVIRLSELDDKTAREMLGELLVQKELTEDEDSITLLVQRLCGLPLALNQAASFINENCISPEEYLSLIDQQEDTMIELLSEDFEDDYRYSEIKNPVASTWLVSFQQIQQSNSQAADYLSFMACVAARDIPMYILPNVDSALDHQKALGLLKSYAFVTEQTDNQLSMHRLVHLAIRNWLKQENQLPEQISESIEHLVSIFPPIHATRRDRWRQILPHAQFVLRLEHSPSIEEKWDLAFLTGKCLHRDGRYAEAHLVMEEVYEARRVLLGEEDEETLDALSWIAIITRRLGRYKESEKHTMKFLDLSKRDPGEDSLVYIDGLNELAGIRHYQGQWDEAEKLFLEVLERMKANHAHDDFRILSTMSELASVYLDQGRLDECEKLHSDVLEKEKTLREPDDPEIATSMAHLADVYRLLGKLEEGEKLLLEVVRMDEARLGKNHPHALASFHSLAAVYYGQGRLEESKEVFLKVIDARKRVLGERHHSTLSSMDFLALIYKDCGLWDDAERIARYIVTASRMDYGLNSLVTLKYIDSLAVLLKERGDYDNALALLEECVELRETHFGASHVLTIRGVSQLNAWQEEMNDNTSVEYSSDASTSSDDFEIETCNSPSGTTEVPSGSLERRGPLGNFHPLLNALQRPVSATNTDDEDID